MAGLELDWEKDMAVAEHLALDSSWMGACASSSHPSQTWGLGSTGLTSSHPKEHAESSCLAGMEVPLRPAAAVSAMETVWPASQGVLLITGLRADSHPREYRDGCKRFGDSCIDTGT